MQDCKMAFAEITVGDLLIFNGPPFWMLLRIVQIGDDHLYANDASGHPGVRVSFAVLAHPSRSCVIFRRTAAVRDIDRLVGKSWQSQEAMGDELAPFALEAFAERN